jgi:hypothetical protein
MFSITYQKGFQITFANGWTASVQFGYRNYCDNRYKGSLNSEVLPSSNAEIACWPKSGEFVNIWDNPEDVSDTVKGYCTPEEVAAFIVKVSEQLA